MTAVEIEAVLTSDDGGTLVPVYVQPRASRTALVGIHDGMLKIALAAPPVDGKANKALTVWLAKALGIRRAEVSLASGLSSRRKRVRVDGLAPQDIAQRLSGA